MAVAVRRWPIVGRRPDIEVFEQALYSGRHAGMMIVGPPGVGKTRLADECREMASRDGHPTERIVGSSTAASLPLGAVASLLAAGLGRDAGQVNPESLFERARLALMRRHNDNRVVTVADDLPQLDSASLALLDYLSRHGAIFLIATARAGEPIPDMATERPLARVDLADLSAAGLDTLLHLALGGPMEAGAAQEFWRITRGNPLYVRELVLGAIESGALVDRSGVWHLDDRLPSTSRLLDLVEQRIAHLSPQARSIVELLALCEPLEQDYLAALAPGVLEPLEQSGLVATDSGEVSLAHPMHGEVVRAAMPRLRARAIRLAQAERLEALSQVPGPVALRTAVWRLDAGGRLEPAILMHGAHLARYTHDFRLVRRLIVAIPQVEQDAVAALLLGEALYELGDFEAADRVLESGQALTAGEHIALRLAVTRAKNAHWGLCQPETALAINADARRVIKAQPFVDELAADRASILMFSGHPDRAMHALSQVAGNDRRTSVVRAIVEAVALAVNGRTTEAVAVAEAGFADHTALGDELAIAHPATHVINQVFALTEAGRLAEAEQLARAGAEVAVSHRVPIAQIWFAANLGRVATLQGRIATARRYYAEAAGLAQAHHFAGPRRMALSGLALAHAMLGDAQAARGMLRERETVPRFGFLEPEQALADAWTALAAGQQDAATERFFAAADQARASGHRTAESWLLHDLIRSTRADVRGRIHELAAACDSPLVLARARHAAAVRARDPVELARSADDFEAMGAMLLAAEAASGCAEALSRSGDRRRAKTALDRSGSLAAACEGAATPGLLRSPAAAQLTGREREIARLAGEGNASKDIAERLRVSARTVDNHLQHIYAKLGVSGRAELARALENQS
ncbi:MAG TPA: LuxR C-terminal-related transcriptional regulator [Streptosporangiaceae bacterium]|nr:LuxR C-terminal-related transcriptional regulator [Streptosporangiaceae bacterium]